MLKEDNNLFKKLVITFVLYNPSKEVRNRIEMFLTNNIDVYVFENSKTNLNLNNKNLFFFGDQTNQGIGIALKKFEIEALTNKKEFMFYLDQDTHVSNQIFRILNFYQQYLALSKKCISINLKDNHDYLFKKVPITINSASLFHLPKLKKIGLHSRDIFLDGIDFEFSLRARRYGFILMKGKSFNSIDHNIGQDGDAIKILGKSHALFKIYTKSRYNNILKISFSLLLKSIFLFDIFYAFELFKFLLFFIIIQAFSHILKLLKSFINYLRKNNEKNEQK